MEMLKAAVSLFVFVLDSYHHLTPEQPNMPPHKRQKLSDDEESEHNEAVTGSEAEADLALYFWLPLLFS